MEIKSKSRALFLERDEAKVKLVVCQLSRHQIALAEKEFTPQGDISLVFVVLWKYDPMTFQLILCNKLK